MPATAITTGYKARLAAAQELVKQRKQQWKDAISARNELVVEAIDSGYSGHQAARDTGMKQPTIVRICSNSQPEVTAGG